MRLWQVKMVHELIADFRFALRTFRAAPGLTAVAVLTLALGIGAATTVYGWVTTVLLNPFPGVAHPGELALLESVTTDGQFLRNISFRDYLDYRDALKPVAQVAATRFTPVHVGPEGRSGRAFAELVTPNFFETLGVTLVAGRGIHSSECSDQPQTCPLVVLSHRYWEAHYGADPRVIGQSLRINRREFVIAGVAPPEFQGGMNGLSFDLWVPLAWAETLGTGGGTLTFRGTRDLTSTFVRLNPGVQFAIAEAAVFKVANQLAADHPRTNRGISARLSPLRSGGNGAQQLLSRPLQLLSGVALIVLLIVCANVCNLLLARSVSRSREFAIRLAMGSGRGRLVRQLLTETFLLALAGSGLGLVVSLWLKDVLVLLLPRTDFPLAFSTPLDVNTLMVCIALAFAVTLATGVAPALLAAKAAIAGVLRDGDRTSSGGRTHRLRGLLVISEVTLAAVVLIGAGLLVQSFRNALALDPGFRKNGILTGQFYLSAAGYTAAEQREFCIRLREALESEPQIMAVSYSDTIPLGLGGSPWHQVTIDGYTPAPGEVMNLHRSLVPPGYFDLLGIPLLDGRDFTGADDARSAGVMIVNQTFAKRYFRERPPIGQTVRIEAREYTVVGVVRDAKYHHPAEAPIPYFYIPFAQLFAPGLNFSFFVQTAGDTGAAAQALRRQASALNPDARVYGLVPLAEASGSALYPQKVAALLLGALAAIGVVLAAVGLFSVMSYAVEQRTREMGVRMALGARPSQVIGIVVRQGASLVVPGLVLGAACAVVVSRWAQGLLVGVRPADPFTYAGACLFLAFVSLAACLIPAFRAARSNPLMALTGE